MARPKRIDVPGLWHHVTNRGKDQQPMFLEEEDFYKILSLLLEVTRWPSGIEIHAYVLMTNHYHFMIYAPNGGLAKAMQHVAGVYNQYFNTKYGHDGALCKGRYFSLVIDSEAHLLELPRYIHNNPVKAGMVEHASDYYWSSHRCLANDEIPPRFLSTHIIVPHYFNGDTQAFDAFVRRQDSADAAELQAALEEQRHSTMSAALAAQADSLQQLCDAVPAVAEVVDFVAQNIDVSVQELSLPSRGHRCDGRELALTVLYRSGLVTATRLAEVFGFASRSSVNSAIHRFEHRSADDPRLQRLLRHGLALIDDLAA